MINQIINLFPVKKIINESENFSNYEIKYKSTVSDDIHLKFTADIYNKINSEVTKLNYKWNFEILELSYSINQLKFELIDEIEEEEITITVQLFKNGNQNFIFNENVFFNSIQDIAVEDLLKILKSKFSNGIKIINNNDSFQTSSSFIGYNTDIIEKESLKISNQCNFGNLTELDFTPENFNLETPNHKSELINLILKINFIFILIYIFDKSEIKKNNVFLKISGYKTLEFDIDFQLLTIESLIHYKNIFEWIYSEKAKIEDKIGIARNILSIYLTDNKIQISENVFNSILSANNTYIKGNISKYLESRNKLHEQLEQISTKLNTSLETFFSNFQKSIFVFISFYLSIFILKVYNRNDPSTAINKEGTIMGLGLLLLSSLFLVFSLYILYLEKNKISTKYSNVKKRHLDLLIEDDINKILNNDEEYNTEISFLKRRRNLYIILWISTILIFLTVLFSTSNYINFKYLTSQD